VEGVPKKLVVFDLDGTLIDSLGDIGDAMNAVLRSLGRPTHHRDRYRFLVGNGLEKLVRRALRPETPDESTISDIVRLTRQEYSTRWTATTRPFTGIPSLLDELAKRGNLVAVLSNKPDHATRHIVDELFPTGPFAMVRGARDGVPLKPDPAALSAMISDLGATPERTAFIGDTAVDMQTGINADLLTIGVTWGFRDEDELLAAGADHVIDSPLELLEILQR
jgi:phosphoglycolate phosphatase